MQTARFASPLPSIAIIAVEIVHLGSAKDRVIEAETAGVNSFRPS